MKFSHVLVSCLTWKGRVIRLELPFLFEAKKGTDCQGLQETLKKALILLARESVFYYLLPSEIRLEETIDPNGKWKDPQNLLQGDRATFESKQGCFGCYSVLETVEENARRWMPPEHHFKSHSKAEVIEAAKRGESVWILRTGSAGEDDILCYEGWRTASDIVADLSYYFEWETYHPELGSDEMPPEWSLQKVWPPSEVAKEIGQ